MSTTMVAVLLLSAPLMDKSLGPRIVPIVADEARTFGMAGCFSKLRSKRLRGSSKVESVSYRTRQTLHSSPLTQDRPAEYICSRDNPPVATL